MTDYITLAKVSKDTGIPKRTLQSACEAGHLKFEWRDGLHRVTTLEWVNEWVSGGKKRNMGKEMQIGTELVIPKNMDWSKTPSGSETMFNIHTSPIIAEELHDGYVVFNDAKGWRFSIGNEILATMGYIRLGSKRKAKG